MAGKVKENLFVWVSTAKRSGKEQRAEKQNQKGCKLTTTSELVCF